MKAEIVERAFTLGPDNALTDDKLLQGVALAVEMIGTNRNDTGRTVYVFEDGLRRPALRVASAASAWHGTLTITTVRRREKIEFELLLRMRPHRKAKTWWPSAFVSSAFVSSAFV